jgi:2-polyprenyl-3-methyl-5-hydroxy-6-metoxy-1,4-benzoquinol methylase
MTWYEDWFNSENYLTVYSHRDESEAERLVKLIVKKLKLKPNSSVLDMACGAGRHAMTFAKMGFEVTAIDLSQRLIAEAMKSAERANVKINFILSDILKFETEFKFDLVVNLFTSIGYFDEDQENFAVIEKAYRSLANDGYFVVDYFNKNYLIKNLVPTTVFSENGVKIVQNRSFEENRVIKKIIIENNVETKEFYESVRLYSNEELLFVLGKAGFRLVTQFGDYYGNNYDSETSPRLIIFAVK